MPHACGFQGCGFSDLPATEKDAREKETDWDHAKLMTHPLLQKPAPSNCIRVRHPTRRPEPATDPLFRFSCIIIGYTIACRGQGMGLLGQYSESWRTIYMIKTGAQILWECLEQQGVTTVFGYPGGAILPAYDALKYSNIHHVLVRHEQGAAHMADGYARASGRVGVAVATSGPGATNLVTGIATAMLDSSPIVCITGQVGSKLIGSDAFQETDITGVTLPVTKHNYLVTHASEVAQTISEAFYVAKSGRPGPVAQPGRRAGPGHHPGTAATPAQHRHPAAPGETGAHRLHWSAWRRRHQHRARQAHHRWNSYAETTP